MSTEVNYMRARDGRTSSPGLCRLHAYVHQDEGEHLLPLFLLDERFLAILLLLFALLFIFVALVFRLTATNCIAAIPITSVAGKSLLPQAAESACQCIASDRMRQQAIAWDRDGGLEGRTNLDCLPSR